MEEKNKTFARKRPNPESGREGSAKKGNWQNSRSERSSENSHSSETVYRIICSSRKIGSVIGKGGGIIRALKDETKARITVTHSSPGLEWRVILVASPSARLARKQNEGGHDPGNQGSDNMEPHCAAQDALLKVHDRIVEEDLCGAEHGSINEFMVTARLLVPNNMVGCLLGRKGDVIQRLRSETGANIRISPPDDFSFCATDTDELVQIAGKPAVAKKALYVVSTLLHQNPRKDNPPLSFPVASGTPHPPGPHMVDMLPPRNFTWPQLHPESNDTPLPWHERHRNQPLGFGPGEFDNFPPAHGEEVPSEFSVKVLCSASKIGGVIGRGGFNVKQLQQDTGASIQVENVTHELDDRVIHVSSFEVIRNPISQTIDAILLLQNQTSECSENGDITTRLLVQSSKVGCILGQGGQVINEMRRRTMADIHVFSKEEKPKCASDDEELVQISGSFAVARDALAEVMLRLRIRCLRDATAKGDRASIGPMTEFSLSGTRRRPPPVAGTGVSSLGRHELYEIAAMRMKFREPFPDRCGHIAEFRKSPEHLYSTRSMYRGFDPSTERNTSRQWTAYHRYSSQLGIYPDTYSLESPYQNYNQEASYENIDMRQMPHENISALGPYSY